MKNKILCGIIAASVAVASLPTAFAADAGSIAIDELSFPDENFRTYVTGFDTDKSGTLSVNECGAVSEIKVNYAKIESLSGIECFTNIKSLECEGNFIATVDISKNTSLESVNLKSNNMQKLTVGKNSALKTLDCSYGNLTELDVSGCSSLKQLNCQANQLERLDLNGHSALEYLDCSINQLFGLNLKGCVNLTELQCTGNNMMSLYVNECSSLKKLDCSENSLVTLDIGKNAAIESVNCYANKLIELTVGKHNALTGLDCSRNNIDSLNVKNCPALIELRCGSNQLTALDVTGNPQIKSLQCDFNHLKSIDVSKNKKLTMLACEANALTFLELSKNTELINLMCGTNRLTSLDLSANTKLASCACSDNQYTIAPKNGRYDLSKLPGDFNVTKAKDWQGAVVKLSTLIIDSSTETIKYKYNIGFGGDISFKLNIGEEDSAEFSLDRRSTVLTAGRSLKLNAVNTTGDLIVWSAVNPKIARINKDGKLIAKSVGRTKITASAGGYTASVTVKVIPKPPKKLTAVKKGKKISFAIKKVNKKYQTYVEYRKGKGKYRKLKITKAARFSKKFAKGKYIFRARTYIKKGSKIYRSTPSKAVKVTVK